MQKDVAIIGHSWEIGGCASINEFAETMSELEEDYKTLFDTYLSTMLQQIGADTAMALVLALQSDRTGTAMPQRPVLCEKVSPSTTVLEEARYGMASRREQHGDGCTWK